MAGICDCFVLGSGSSGLESAQRKSAVLRTCSCRGGSQTQVWSVRSLRQWPRLTKSCLKSGVDDGGGCRNVVREIEPTKVTAGCDPLAPICRMKTDNRYQPDQQRCRVLVRDGTAIVPSENDIGEILPQSGEPGCRCPIRHAEESAAERSPQQTFSQSAHRALLGGMFDIRRDVTERIEYESAIPARGVRHVQAMGLEDQVVVENQIQVERPWRPMSVAHSPAPPLDRL